MRVLFIGDPHAVANELDDCRRLIDLVYETCSSYSVDLIVFLGDLHHNHGLIDAEVQYFWIESFNRLNNLKVPIYIINGNHDSPNNKATKASALHAYSVKTIINQPICFDDFLFCPYTSDESKLINWSNQYPKTPVLVCHQTFKGAVYENGVAALDHFDQNKLSQKLIISGHIHTPMEISGVNRVVYIGAPRWRSVKDANLDRFLRLITFKNGEISEDVKIRTSTHCTPIYALEDKESSPLDLKPLNNAKYVIDIHGSESFVNSRRGLYPYARVRAYPTKKNIILKESEGLDKAMSKWINEFKPPNNTNKQELLDRLSKIWPLK